MRGMRFVTILLLAAACGGGASKSTATQSMGAPTAPVDPIPATGGPDCAVVADKVAPVARAEQPDAQDELRAAVRTRCSEDQWSDEARSCFATIENDAELDGCLSKLTDEQRQAAATTFGRSGEPEKGAMPGPKSAPPPPPKERKTRGAVQRNSSDPEEGGEAKADPEEGGEKR